MRQCPAHSVGAASEGLVHTREVIPTDVVHLGFEKDFRMP